MLPTPRLIIIRHALSSLDLWSERCCDLYCDILTPEKSHQPSSPPTTFQPALGVASRILPPHHASTAIPSLPPLSCASWPTLCTGDTTRLLRWVARATPTTPPFQRVVQEGFTRPSTVFCTASRTPPSQVRCTAVSSSLATVLTHPG